MDNVKDEDELQKTASTLEDRFGKIPKQTMELFNIVRIRWIAIKLGIERISMKGGKMLCYFVSEDSSPYFQTQTFGNILLYLQKHPRNTQMKQVGGKACIVVSGIDNTQKALSFLDGVLNNK